MIYLAIIVSGLAIGSFLNVVIHRLPLGRSVVFPRSHCPGCKRRLSVLENVPVLSYVIQRGSCRGCGQTISPRYLFVELLTPLLLLGSYLLCGASWDFVRNGILILLLIPVTFIDLSHRLILDRITVPGMVIGILVSVAYSPSAFYLPLLGLLAGGGFLWFIALAAQLIYKKESLGGGDIKLGAMIGAFVGPQTILLALFLAFFVAAVYSLIGMAVGRLDRKAFIPFGPFIALGALSVVHFQHELIRLYLNYLVP